MATTSTHYLELAELAELMNPVIPGWMNYYGKFYRTEMFSLLRHINTYLVRGPQKLQTVKDGSRSQILINAVSTVPLYM